MASKPTTLKHEEDRSLFPDPDGGETTGTADRAARMGIAFLFLAICTTIGVADAVAPITPPALTGAEKDQEEEVRRNARISDGTRMALLEKDMKRSSRVRDLTAGTYAFTLFKLFHEIGPSAVVGPNGWVFLSEIIGDSPRSDAEIAEVAIPLVAAAARRFENRGVRWISVPIPRKPVVAISELPKGIDPRPGIEAAVLESLETHGVEFVDLTEAIAAVPVQDAFQPWDTHWGDGARLAAAEKIAADLGVPADAERNSRIVRIPNYPTHSFSLRTAGIYSGKEPPKWVEVLTPKQLGVKVEGLRLMTGRPYISPKDMSRAVLIGSSYSVGPQQQELMEHFFGERVRNASIVALQIIENCGPFLAETRTLGMPELVWHEFPMHHVLLMDVGSPLKHLRPALVAMFIEEPAGPQQVLRSEAELAMALTKGGGKAGTWILEEGRAASSGDGILSLRIRRQGSFEGPLSMSMRTGSYRIPIEIPAGQAEAVAPILERRRSGETLYFETQDRDADVELELVTDVALDRPIAEAASIARTENGDMLATFPSGRKVRRFAGLLLEFEDSPSEPQVVLVEVRAGGKSADFDVLIGPGGCAVLNVGALRGKELQSVRISGSGPEGSPIATKVSLHPHLQAKE